MEKNNIKLLVEKARREEKTELFDAIKTLKEKRIFIIHNKLNEIIGLSAGEAEDDKKVIMTIVRFLNEYASKNKVDFHIDEDWESIELFLKNTIMDDIMAEFERQAAQ